MPKRASRHQCMRWSRSADVSELLPDAADLPNNVEPAHTERTTAISKTFLVALLVFMRFVYPSEFHHLAFFHRLVGSQNADSRFSTFVNVDLGIFPVTNAIDKRFHCQITGIHSTTIL